MEHDISISTDCTAKCSNFKFHLYWSISISSADENFNKIDTYKMTILCVPKVISILYSCTILYLYDGNLRESNHL